MKYLRKIKINKKYLKQNKFNEFFDSNLFESKFVYITREPGDENVEPTPSETGDMESEGIVNRFDARYNPEYIPYAVSHPDEVIFGVRKRMSSVLHKEEVLDERIQNRLEYIRHNAPRHYKQIIDEEVRRRGGGPTSARYRIANILGFGMFSREWAEREVARDFFTYAQIPGGNYNTMLANLDRQIAAIGQIAGGTWLDGLGQPVNLGMANPVNHFGPNGRDIVRWNDMDYDVIQKIMERNDVWADFSRQPGAREYINLKFRHTQLKGIIHQERAKLTADRFDPQRLQTWLDNEASDLAMRDNQFQNWVTGRNNPALFPNPADRLNTYPNMEALRTGNTPLYNTFLNQRKRAIERVRANTMEQMLKDILVEGELENIDKRIEVRSMLAYLQAGLNDPQDGPNVREFIRSLAGRSDRVDDLKDDVTEWKNNEKSINKALVNWATDYNNYASLYQQRNSSLNAIAALRRSQDDNAPDRLANEEKRRSKIEEQLNQTETELINMVWDLRMFIRDNLSHSVFNGDMNAFIDNNNEWRQLDSFITNPVFRNKASGSRPNISNFLNQFQQYAGNEYFMSALKKLLSPVQGEKIRIENELAAAQSSEGQTEKMDSKGLLGKLVERDLKLRGVTVEKGLQKKTVYATNMIITKARHINTYGATNKRLSNAPSPIRAALRNAGQFFLPQDWLPVLSATDVLRHVVDTDPDLAMFHDITVFSTRADLQEAMDRIGKVSSRKLREMQMKLAEFIKGIKVPTKKGIFTKIKDKTIALAQLENIMGPKGRKIVPGKTYTVRAEEAPMLENIIHILSLMEAQIERDTFIEELREDESINPEKDYAKLFLKKLERSAEDSRAMDEAIYKDLKDHHALWKKRLMLSEERKIFNEAADSMPDGMPKEEENEEFDKMAMNARRRSQGIISLRTRRFLKKAGKGFLKYGPHTWPFWAVAGVGYGGYKAYKGYMKLFTDEPYKKAKETEIMDWTAFARLPGNVVGSVYSIARRIALWPTKVLDIRVRKGSDKYYAKRIADA